MSFIVEDKQARILEQLNNEKARQRLRASLVHFDLFKTENVRRISPAEQTAGGVLKLLSRDREAICFLICEDIRLDAAGQTNTFGYNALDQITKVTYPDETYEQIVYDKLHPE